MGNSTVHFYLTGVFSYFLKRFIIGHMMADWQRHLKADPTGWLLEDENPSVRYFTLMDILAMIRCGYLTDKRVQKGIDWIIQYKRCDDRNSHAPAGWPYDQFPRTGVCR